ncbi:MFP transporter [Burkholderia paludis]|uniref:HlyD family secretion protein n=1 Tax=Burkholderia paludis TaxID=1506587 RepID=UPI0004DB7549|nr:HlyD family efflux transporter periplasmic adaptor subunit [Burkholderia paludis]KFG94296.1 MFP transporter [Burkholderia paludis]
MTPPPSLFRSEARQAQEARSLGEILLIRPLSLTVMTAVAACMGVAVIVLLACGTYTRRTTVDGLVVPDAGLVKIYAQQPGLVLSKAAVEGARVARGQALYTISTDVRSEGAGPTQAALMTQAHERKASLQHEIAATRELQGDERRTSQAKVDSLRADLAGIDDQIAAQRTRAAIAADAATRYAGLLAQDYVSKDQAQQRDADSLDQQSKLRSLQRDRAGIVQQLAAATSDLAGLPLKQQNQLAQIDRSVMDVDQSLIESAAKSTLVATAPEAGIATAMIAQPGQFVDTEHPLASIVPDGSHWQAQLFVSSAAIGFVRTGDPVLIRYQAYPYQKFGQYRAHVLSIAHVALSAAELAVSGYPAGAAAGALYYRVTVALQDESVVAYGKRQPLQAGMALQADILQERRHLYEWVLAPLYSLTGKL